MVGYINVRHANTHGDPYTVKNDQLVQCDFTVEDKEQYHQQKTDTLSEKIRPEQSFELRFTIHDPFKMREWYEEQHAPQKNIQHTF